MAKKLIKIDKSTAERRYKVQVVSQAIGFTEGVISGYFNNQGISVKDGITAKQVVEVATARRRGNGVDWDSVEALKAELSALGYEVIDTDDLDDEEDK